MCEETVSRELKKHGFTLLTARQRHVNQDKQSLEEFKNNFSDEVTHIRTKLPAGTALEIWWQDEARLGQKTKTTRRWAPQGTRPVAPVDQRRKSAYIFGAICPKRGVGAGIVMPQCNTQAMKTHLEEIAELVAAYALLIVDQAAWHTTEKLEVPENITLVQLPPRSPELNPMENIWQYIRNNWLSNLIFDSLEEIINTCCDAWNKLVELPESIPSFGMREWALRF